MADSLIARPKRQGNYVPERIKALETEIAAKYLEGFSARYLAREFGVSKTGVRAIIDRAGIPARDKVSAGKSLRHSFVSPDDPALQKSVSDTVYEAWIKVPGRENDKRFGLTNNREFRTACAREYRRRNYANYRELEARRKRSVNRMPKWANKDKIRLFYEMASDLGLSVDHIIPLQGKTICGLHVENNLQLMSQQRNCAKTNTFSGGSDWQIGPPSGALGMSHDAG